MSRDSLFLRYNPPMAVTRRQKEIIDFLESFISRNGYSPSFEEIARGMRLKSLATVHKHITNLEKKGFWIGSTTGAGRLMFCPRVRALDRATGYLWQAVSQLECPLKPRRTTRAISLHDMVGNRDVFALEVRGDSMRDEHIINGDYVLVERTRTARQGEIVVALVHGSETTLKRFYAEGRCSACSRPTWRWIPFTFRQPRLRFKVAFWVFAQISLNDGIRSKAKCPAVCRAFLSEFASSQKPLNLFLNYILRDVADDLICHFAAFKEEQGSGSRGCHSERA